MLNSDSEMNLKASKEFAKYIVSYFQKLIDCKKEEDYAEMIRVFAELVSVDIKQFIEYKNLITHAQNPQDGLFLDVNRYFTKRIVLIAEHLRHNPSEVDGMSIKILPLSVSHLDPQGAMSELYGMQKEQRSAIASHLEEHLSRGRQPLCRAKDKYLLQCDSPQLVCFPAGNGDSTLFRWHGFNMLVDGGRRKRDPCFWPVVSRLPEGECLDVVIVTHYDDDHICGILGLFEERELPLEVKKLYTTTTPSGDDSSRFAKKGNQLVEKAKGKSVTVCNLQASNKPLFCNSLGKGDCLEVYMLTPTEENLKEAQKEMENSRGLTIPNKASASLLIHCNFQDGTSRFALLTGDAPCKDIFDCLEKIKPKESGKFKVDYADVPHHGSSNPENNPQKFLSSIETPMVMISTDGKLHEHPDDDTLKYLKKSLQDGNVKNALFTYEEHKTKEIRRKNEKHRESPVCEYVKPNQKSKICKHFEPNQVSGESWKVSCAENRWDEARPVHCMVINLKDCTFEDKNGETDIKF